MADLSNGYTRIANEIQKLKPRLRMSGREWQCLEAVIWLTYGWNKKQDRVTNTVIARLTGLADSRGFFVSSSTVDRRITLLLPEQRQNHWSLALSVYKSCRECSGDQSNDIDVVEVKWINCIYHLVFLEARMNRDPASCNLLLSCNFQA